MHDVEQRIRDAYGPVEIERDARDRGWDTLQLGTMPATTRRVRRMRSPRLLVAIAVLVVSVSSIAIAQPGAVGRLVGFGDDRPADRMQVFEDEPVGLRGLSETTREMLAGPAGEDPAAEFRSPIDPDQLRSSLTYRNERIAFDLRSAPSQDGEACLVFTLSVRGTNGRMREHSGGSGCSLAMRYNGHLTVGTMGDIRMGRLVFGLVDDAVSQVRVQLSDGRVVRAHMGRNGFALHLADPAIRTRGLEVELRDGRTLEVAMNGCLRSQVVPPPRSRLGCGYGMNKGPDPADLR